MGSNPALAAAALGIFGKKLARFALAFFTDFSRLRTFTCITRVSLAVSISSTNLPLCARDMCRQEAQPQVVRDRLDGGSWKLVREYTEVESGTAAGAREGA
jgi:hypothetical protein